MNLPRWYKLIQFVGLLTQLNHFCYGSNHSYSSHSNDRFAHKPIPEALKRLYPVSNHFQNPITAMSMNVGTAQVLLNLKGLYSTTPYHKLENPKVIKNIQNHLKRYSPDVLLLQETQGEEQLFSTFANGPLITSDLPYEGRCPKSSQNFRVENEICVLWDKEKWQLDPTQKECSTYSGKEGGAVRCLLVEKKTGHHLQAVSVHPSAQDWDDRMETLEKTWTVLIDRSIPTLLGGDFNTQDCTMGFDCSLLYPPEFWTLFGAHQKGQGIRKAQEKTFFGTYENDVPVKKVTAPYLKILRFLGKPFGIRGSVDHLFVNFGNPKNFSPNEQSNPVSYSYVANSNSHYTYPVIRPTLRLSSMGWEQDHLPIVGRIGERSK